MSSIIRVHTDAIPSGYQVLLKSFPTAPEFEPCRFYDECTDTRTNLCQGYFSNGNHKSLSCPAYEERLRLSEIKRVRKGEKHLQDAIDDGADAMKAVRAVRARLGKMSRAELNDPVIVHPISADSEN